MGHQKKKGFREIGSLFVISQGVARNIRGSIRTRSTLARFVFIDSGNNIRLQLSSNMLYNAVNVRSE